MKLTIVAALLASASVPAVAGMQEISFNGPLAVDFSNGTAGIDTSFAVTPFDARLGTLTFVTFGFDATFDATFSYAAKTNRTFDIALSYASPANPARYELRGSNGGSTRYSDTFGQVTGDYDFGASVRNSRKGSIEFGNSVTVFGFDDGGDLTQTYAQSDLAFHFTYFPQMSVNGIDPADYSWTIANAGSGTVRYYYDDASSPAVPEPATWATMMAGIGLAGVALRRRRRRSPVGIQSA